MRPIGVARYTVRCRGSVPLACAPVLHINSADDFVNPPELENVGPPLKRVPGAQFVLLPITERTRGHGTHSMPAIWGHYMRDFLATLPER